MFDSSASHIFRTNTGIHSEPDGLEESRSVMICLTILGITRKLCNFRIVLGSEADTKVLEKKLHITWSKAIQSINKNPPEHPSKFLKMTYQSLFLFPLIVWVSTKNPIKYNQYKKILKLQSRALRKILFKKQQDSISQVYKDFKTLKFSDLLYLQDCLFNSETETDWYIYLCTNVPIHSSKEK